MGARHDHRALLGSGFADDSYSGCAVENKSDAGADDRMVVNEQYACVHESNLDPA